jgi:leucyl/phenylalanyl-tRNA--protein transferase
MMFGESMFSHRTDASKIALAGLVAFCRWNDMPLIDCQQATGHLASLGASPIPRAQFEREALAQVARTPTPVWAYDFRIWGTLDLGVPADPAAVPAPDALPLAPLSTPARSP